MRKDKVREYTYRSVLWVVEFKASNQGGPTGYAVSEDIESQEEPQKLSIQEAVPSSALVALRRFRKYTTPSPFTAFDSAIMLCKKVYSTLKRLYDDVRCHGRGREVGPWCG